MEDDTFDAVCVGEGEFPTLELMDKMANEKSIYDTESFYLEKMVKLYKIL